MSESEFWFCVKHHTRREGDDGCPPIDRLGPYATREEAARALDKVEERNEEWDNDPSGTTTVRAPATASPTGRRTADHPASSSCPSPVGGLGDIGSWPATLFDRAALVFLSKRPGELGDGRSYCWLTRAATSRSDALGASPGRPSGRVRRCWSPAHPRRATATCGRLRAPPSPQAWGGPRGGNSRVGVVRLAVRPRGGRLLRRRPLRRGWRPSRSALRRAFLAGSSWPGLLRVDFLVATPSSAVRSVFFGRGLAHRCSSRRRTLIVSCHSARCHRLAWRRAQATGPRAAVALAVRRDDRPGVRGLPHRRDPGRRRRAVVGRAAAGPVWLVALLLGVGWFTTRPRTVVLLPVVVALRVARDRARRCGLPRLGPASQ